jgi:hypothetical protein
MMHHSPSATSTSVGQQPTVRIGRRTALRSAGGMALAGAALPAVLPIASAAAQPSRALTGVWLVVFLRDDVPPGTIPNRAPALFTADGGVVIGFRTSNLNMQTGARTYHGGAVGAWTRTSPGEFVWAYAGFNWDDQNLLTGYSQFRVMVALNDAADRFEGTFSGGGRTVEGDPAGPELTGTITGHRLLSVP